MLVMETFGEARKVGVKFCHISAWSGIPRTPSPYDKHQLNSLALNSKYERPILNY